MRRTKAESLATRVAILRAAEDVFFKRGFANATLSEIATNAGLTRGAIYWHFANKSDLLMEMCGSLKLPPSDIHNKPDADKDGDVLDELEMVIANWMMQLSSDVRRQRLLVIVLRQYQTDDVEETLHLFGEFAELEERKLAQYFVCAELQGVLAKNWTAASASAAIKWLLTGLAWEWLFVRQNTDLIRVGAESSANLFRSFRNG